MQLSELFWSVVRSQGIDGQLAIVEVEERKWTKGEGKQERVTKLFADNWNELDGRGEAFVFKRWYDNVNYCDNVG